jgi:hypothetical protein
MAAGDTTVGSTPTTGALSVKPRGTWKARCRTIQRPFGSSPTLRMPLTIAPMRVIPWATWRARSRITTRSSASGTGLRKKERPETGAEVSKRLESVKHLLWHGNTEEALERLGDMLVELGFIQARSNAAKKVADGLSEFETYICNNREFIPNFGERRRPLTITSQIHSGTRSFVVDQNIPRHRWHFPLAACAPLGRPPPQDGLQGSRQDQKMVKDESHGMNTLVAVF